ncbi:sodium bicarbonate cotransporter 3-like isoform X9 [Phycodurus eques]|uniref:sodium bicarbonate cotransporter 3-like isoform X9 n=1 Tax=Phycodurus eques TaxID=693459 RepID=UPI002ACD6B1F|nr:sodium bicarbonate cotransporter 3-like isoform X9 [Phycodurus eques]
MAEDVIEQMRPLLTSFLGTKTGHLALSCGITLLWKEEEALLDRGNTSSTLYTNFEEEELESHRALYVSIHVPLGRHSRRRHRHRGHRHEQRKQDCPEQEDACEPPSYDTPSQRVQFILGMEDNNEEHVPHQLFSELDELAFRDGEVLEWKETARWLKFEEDVEDGGERWSKPYVGSLSLHSLFELRACIMNGTIILDMRANAIEQIADMVIDNMLASGQMDEHVQDKVREAILKRHRHQIKKRLSKRIPLVRSFTETGKKHSDPHLLEHNVGLLTSPQSAPGNLDASKGAGGGINPGSCEKSVVDFSKVDMDFMKKIPPGAEASNVLVGEVDFLEKPIVAFVRLAPAVLISGLTQVPVPTSDYSLCYLSLRTSIGLWTAFFCLLLVATDASSLVCYITRFTEEAFAALICFIFIYEALEKLLHLGHIYPVNKANHLDNLTLYTCECSQPAKTSDEIREIWRMWNYNSSASIPWKQLSVKLCHTLRGEFVGAACGHDGPFVPDVLFWSIIVFFTTFYLSTFFKDFKNKKFFPTKVRSIISDFAVFLTILLMVLLDYLVGIPSPKLSVPDRFQPTSNHRGWLISPLGPNPWWSLLAAGIPALLCTILIFMDQQITAVIINRKENKLKKGCGYHLDLLVVGVMMAVCSIMGLPWFVAATVLSITHINSLRLESACAAPGEQPKFLGIREQRITGFMIFLLMGCSVFMTSILKFIPMPVLYGVFLYMGVSSLKGIQLFDRIQLFAMAAKHQPDLIYLRYVPLRKVHAFTAVQLSCLIILWIIKVSAIAVVFPMMVLALVFIRKLMDFGFSKRELSWLDDLIPESKKKKDDDKKKKRETEDADWNLEGAVDNSAYNDDDANVIESPVKSVKRRMNLSEVNISSEMGKKGLWKSRSMTRDTNKALKPGSQEPDPSVSVAFEEGLRVEDVETVL